MREAGASDDRPRFLERHGLHPIEDGIGHLGAAVREALAFPVGGVFDELLLRQHAWLRRGERRDREQQRDGNERSHHGGALYSRGIA